MPKAFEKIYYGMYDEDPELKSKLNRFYDLQIYTDQALSAVRKLFADSFKIKKDKIFLHGSRSILLKRPEYTKDSLTWKEFDIFEKTSDVDIATPWNAFVKEVLLLRGWSNANKNNNVYSDSYTPCVLEKEICGQKVQMSFKTNFDNYRVLWEHLSDSFYKKFLWKHSSNFIGADAMKDLFASQQNMMESSYGITVHSVLDVPVGDGGEVFLLEEAQAQGIWVEGDLIPAQNVQLGQPLMINGDFEE